MEQTHTKDMEILLGPAPPPQGTAGSSTEGMGSKEVSMRNGGSTGEKGKILEKLSTNSDWTMCKFADSP